MWFHVLCIGPLLQPNRRIVAFIRFDDVWPSGVFLRAIVVPRGAFFLAFAAYPTIAFIRGPLRRYRRRKRGLCFNCGYDLTGNVSGRCPECGAEVEAE